MTQRCGEKRRRSQGDDMSTNQPMGGDSFAISSLLFFVEAPCDSRIVLYYGHVTGFHGTKKEA